METLRVVNEGAEKLLYKQISVLNHGYITLVDYSGVDESVVSAARVSYAKDTDFGDVEKNTKLINFLMRNEHMSPFEMPELTFHVKAPIFVFREWHRHRTASLNEMSGRYTQMPEEFYIPTLDRIKGAHPTNKQSSEAELQIFVKADAQDAIKENGESCFEAYKEMLLDGVAKEISRVILPVGTYSMMQWKCDLRNIFHFLELRLAAGAQWEIRQYARQMELMIQQCFPKIYTAWEDHVKYGVKFSQVQVGQLLNILQSVLALDAPPNPDAVKDILNSMKTQLTYPEDSRGTQAIRG